MDLTSSAISFLSFLGTLASMFLATWTWHLCTLADANSSKKTFSRPGSPSIIPKRTWLGSKPLLLTSLNSSRQTGADSLLPACKAKTVRCPFSVTPTTTRTGTFSTDPSIRMEKRVPSMYMYLMGSKDKSRSRQASTAWVSSRLALLTSIGESFLPIRVSDIMERVRVLTPLRNMTQRSLRMASSYCLLRGIT